MRRVLLPAAFIVAIVPAQAFGDPTPPSGEAGTAIPASKSPFGEVYGRVNSVAVISVLGDTLRFCKTSAPGKTDAVRSVMISDWNLDSELEASMRAVLATRFVVKDAQADRDVLSQDMTFSLARNGKLHDTMKADGLHPSYDTDAILALVKKPSSAEIPCQGIGIAKQTTPSGDRYWAFASYIAVVFKGSSLEILSIKPGAVTAASPEPGAVALPDSSLWPTEPGVPTPEQKERIHSILGEMLKKTVPDAIARAGLLSAPLASSGSSR